ncbi:MAG: tail-specific protease [Bacteroidetes bacterium]|nr:tail-specific protease [Bacteroidota bacterium]
MKRLPVVLALFGVALLLTLSSIGSNKKSTPPGKYEEVLHRVVQMLQEDHYQPQSIDDGFSKKIFNKYLSELDGNKNYFLNADIEQFQSYATRLDNEMLGKPVRFFLVAGGRFQERMEEVATLTRSLLEKPLEFTKNENIRLEDDKLMWPANEKERQERWRKQIKYQVLERYNELIEQREKNRKVPDFVVKSDQELEKEARDRVRKVMDRTFDRYRNKFSADDQFNLYVNTVTNAMDPHTEFFPPIDKRYFDEEMSGRFYGIGASLQYDEGNIKITSVVTGSPAYKSGQIQSGDIILKVAQGPEEPVDLTGFLVTDAVKLIRGKLGTEVRLTIRKPDGSLKTVALIRDEIVQDESFARSAIFTRNGQKIGYIFLPEFYADFDRADGARCFLDVSKEIRKLKQQNIEGLVMDLRNNGGGSLYDVVQMVGLFIDEGPIVQVKDRAGRPTVLRDKDKGILYDGPLTVMVNEFSASASEIFAAAIQDYGRGIVIGSSSTYGKGTVQRNMGLDPASGFFSSNSDLGTVKMTLQKFYRINGGSTQLKGVSSDIILPDNLETLKIREKDNEDALTWDEINKVTYQPWSPTINLAALKQKHLKRMANNTRFQKIRENSSWLAKTREQDYPLDLVRYQQLQRKIQETVKLNDQLSKLEIPLTVTPLPGDLERWNNDKPKQERYKAWLKSLELDIYLEETIQVTTDMIRLEGTPANR